MFSCEKPVILLVEDNEDDVVMIRHALKKAHVPFPLQVVCDGREALGYLNGEGKYDSADYPLPALILLDLRLPRMDGFEVLRWIRRQPQLEATRVIVLTSSSDPADATVAYALGANSFLTKTADFQDATRLLLVIIAQWLPAGTHRRNVGKPSQPNRVGKKLPTLV